MNAEPNNFGEAVQAAQQALMDAQTHLYSARFDEAATALREAADHAANAGQIQLREAAPPTGAAEAS